MTIDELKKYILDEKNAYRKFIISVLIAKGGKLDLKEKEILRNLLKLFEVPPFPWLTYLVAESPHHQRQEECAILENLIDIKKHNVSEQFKAWFALARAAPKKAVKLKRFLIENRNILSSAQRIIGWMAVARYDLESHDALRYCLERDKETALRSNAELILEFHARNYERIRELLKASELMDEDVLTARIILAQQGKREDIQELGEFLDKTNIQLDAKQAQNILQIQAFQEDKKLYEGVIHHICMESQCSYCEDKREDFIVLAQLLKGIKFKTSKTRHFEKDVDTKYS